MTARRTVLTLLLALPALPAFAAAQWSTSPASHLSVGDGPSDQILPRVVPTADGGAWVSWFDGIGTGYDVRVQRLDAAGVEQLAHNGVLVADRGFSSVQGYGLAVDSAENALLAFRDDSGVGTQITVAKVSPSGLVLWSQQVTSTAAFVASPVVTAMINGSAVVAWTEDVEAKVARLDAGGVLQWVQTLTPGAGSYSPSDVHAHEVDAVVAFVHQTGGFGSPRHLYAQKLDGNGALLWGAGHVPVFTGGSLQNGSFPGFVPDGAGGGVFAWYGVSPLQCFAQHVLADGTQAFGAGGVAVSTDATRVRVSPSADYDATTGDTYVFWTEQNGLQSMSGLYGQRLDASGARLWSSTGAALVPLSADSITWVTTLATHDGPLVAWERSTGFGADVLRGARVGASGAFAAGPFDVSSTPSSKLRLVGRRSTAGFAILAWGDDRVDGGSVLAQSVNPDGSLGSAGPGTASCFGVSCPCGNDDPGAGCANSTGAGAVLAGAGTTSVSADDLVLTASGLPPMNQGLFYMGDAFVSAPLFDGRQCVLGSTWRFLCCIQSSGASGTMTLGPGIAAQAGGLVVPGTVWHFHAWHRDVPGSPCGTGSNLSSLYSVPFAP